MDTSTPHTLRGWLQCSRDHFILRHCLITTTKHFIFKVINNKKKPLHRESERRGGKFRLHVFATCVPNFPDYQSINTFQWFLQLLDQNCVGWGVGGGLETDMTPICAIKREENRRTCWAPDKSYSKKQESEEFRGASSLSHRKKEEDFQEKEDDISSHLPLRVPGTPFPPFPLVQIFPYPRKIGGSLHWWSYNSCCHVRAFTVKLRHARHMSLGTKWRLHVFCVAILKWGGGWASAQKGFPHKKYGGLIDQIRKNIIPAVMLQLNKLP